MPATAYVPTAEDDAALPASAYIPTDAEMEAVNRDWNSSSYTDPYGDPASHKPAAAPAKASKPAKASPGLNALRKMAEQLPRARASTTAKALPLPPSAVAFSHTPSGAASDPASADPAADATTADASAPAQPPVLSPAYDGTLDPKQYIDPNAQDGDPIGHAFFALDHSAQAYTAAPSYQTEEAHRQAVSAAVKVLQDTGAAARQPIYQAFIASAKKQGWLYAPSPALEKAPEPDVMDRVMTYLDSPEANNPFGTGLHVGKVAGGLVGLGRDVVDAIPGAAESLAYHAIGQGDQYDIEHVGTPEGEGPGEQIGGALMSPAMAVLPFGGQQAGEALQAYNAGDTEKAKRILEAAPGQIGQYAKENKLEAALMLLPGFLHGAGKVRGAVAAYDPIKGIQDLNPVDLAEDGSHAPGEPAQAATEPAAVKAAAVQAAASEPAARPAAPVPPARNVGGVPRGRQKPALGNPMAPTPAQEARPAPAAPTPEPPPAAVTVDSNTPPAAPSAPPVETAPAASPVAPAAAPAPPGPAARVAAETHVTEGTGATFTPKADDLKAAPAKLDAKTGMTAAQKTYLSDALTNYAHTPEANGATEAPAPPHVIDVPGDGRYTVEGVVQANALHVNLTGKGILLTRSADGQPLPEPIDLNARFQHKPGNGQGYGDAGAYDPPRRYGTAEQQGLPKITVPAKDRAAVLAKYAAEPPSENVPTEPETLSTSEGNADAADTAPLGEDAYKAKLRAAYQGQIPPEQIEPAVGRAWQTHQTEQAAMARLRAQATRTAGKDAEDPLTEDPLAQRDAAPEHGDAAPTPAAPHDAPTLTPQEHAAITSNLAKVADDPEVAPLAREMQAEADVARAGKMPRIANSAGLFGGKAVSDILESAQDRIGAAVSHVTSAAADSALARATRNGRFRGSYEVDKAAGDAVNQLAASGESARTYAHYATLHVLDGLDAKQRALFVDHLLDERASAIEAQGGTPNRADLRALSPQEKAQIAADPKLQAALLKFEGGPMGTVQQLRQFVSPRMALSQTASGRFLSLLAKKDAAGSDVNGRAASGRPASGMSGRGQVRGTSHAQQATGTAQAYSHDLGEILTHDLSEVNKKANLKQLYKTLLAQRDAQGNRLAYSSALKTGQALPDTITYNGREYPAVDVAPGWRYVDKAGKIREVRIRVPAPVAADLEDALTPPKPGNDIGAVAQQAAGFATSLSLMTPAELTGHVGRILSAAAKMAPANVPFAPRVGEALLPYIGPRAGTLYRLFNTDMSDPANVAVLQRIMDANGGSGRPFREELGRSLLAQVPGLKQAQNFSHDFLFSLPEGRGLSGFDLRLRVMAEKMREAAEGNTDPKRVREFASQFGQYTSKPDRFVQSLRTVAPFAATSMPVKLTEARLLMGNAGYRNLTPAQAATLHAETLFRGTAGSVLGLMLANHALSGHWPWQNAPGHETDLEAGKDKNGKPVYIAGNRLDPTLSRPLTSLGVPDMIADLHGPKDAKGKGAKGQAGKSIAENKSIAEKLAADAGRGIYNAAGSSVSSPALQAFTTMISGHDPLYVTRSGQMLPTSPTAKKGSSQSQALNNLKAGVGGLNPVLGAITHTDKQSRETPYQAPLWRTLQQMERLTGPMLKSDEPLADQPKPKPTRYHRPHRSRAIAALRAMSR